MGISKYYSQEKNMNWCWGQVGFDLKQQAGTEVFFGIHVSNAKKPDCLGYIGDYTTHGYRDYKKPL